MKQLSALGFAILAIVPQVIGQENLHMNAGNDRVNIGFTADNIERQDPSGDAGFASVVHLKGNVVIRACCMQHGLQQTQPRQAMFMRGQEAVYHGDTGEIEFNGNVKVSFQDYPTVSSRTLIK
jgi:hypothetical protein